MRVDHFGGGDTGPVSVELQIQFFCFLHVEFAACQVVHSCWLVLLLTCSAGSTSAILIICKAEANVHCTVQSRHDAKLCESLCFAS